MENKVPVYRIIRNIASNGREQEKEIRDWQNNSPENKKIYQDLLNVWQVTGNFPDRFFPDRAKAWTKVRQHIKFQKRKYILFRRIAQVAAAAVIVFLSVWAGTELDNFRQQSFYTEVISPAGQKSRILLPDSSVVMLNGGSLIRYNQDFNHHSRKVELEGEGYFEVRKNRSKQFVVRTSELNIKVFGTSFNVKAYKNDQTVEVGLKNGQIGIDRNEKEIVKLVPDQVATFYKNEKRLNVKKTDMNVVSAWTRDELVFEEDSMEKIMKYIERWYGIDITIAPDLLDGELYTFKVKTESLQELLKLINLLRPIKYQINGKQVIITNP